MLGEAIQSSTSPFYAPRRCPWCVKAVSPPSPSIHPKMCEDLTALMKTPKSFRRLLRTRPRSVSLAIANGAALTLSGFRFDTEHACQLGIDLFPLGDQFFHPCDLSVDIH